MRRTARWLVLASLSILGTTGCSDAFGIDDVLGTWEAVRANGMSVPGDVEAYVGDATETIWIQYDRIHFLDADQCTYSSQMGLAEPLHTDNCTHAVNPEAESITITLFGNFSGTGVFDGNELTVSWPNTGGPPNIVVYQRQ